MPVHSFDEADDDASDHLSILKLGPCIFVTVPPQLGDTQARALRDAVAARLARTDDATALIIDVAALAVVDSYAAKVLQETATVARSFGARSIIVGLRPAVAATLVDLGIDLGDIETALTLERALYKVGLQIVHRRTR